jgi:hypothetical protein
MAHGILYGDNIINVWNIFTYVYGERADPSGRTV